VVVETRGSTNILEKSRTIIPLVPNKSLLLVRNREFSSAVRRHAADFRVARLLLITLSKTRKGRKGIKGFSNDKSMRHRIDVIRTRLVAQRRQRKETERTTMQTRVRIIKRNAGSIGNILPTNQSEKTDQQLDREMVNTVKSWVAECEARNRSAKAAALSLLHSLEVSRQKLAAPVRV
jgi:hypothetical protein